MSAITVDSLHDAFANGLDAAARVRARRPGVFQIELPAFMGDGDAAQIYVRRNGGHSLVLTDLGSTRTRLSYQRRLTGDLDEELARLAEGQGFALEDGEIRVHVDPRELVAAALGLLQVEAQADRLAGARKRHAHESALFREQVLSLIHGLFSDLREPFYDEKNDPDALYKVDALITAPKPLAIALVPGDLDAERAVGAKLALTKYAPEKTRWIAIPRDMERLASRTRQRLNREFITAGSTFEEDRDIVRDRLRDLADVA